LDKLGAAQQIIYAELRAIHTTSFEAAANDALVAYDSNWGHRFSCDAALPWPV
jgi:hypothetical protein